MNYTGGNQVVFDLDMFSRHDMPGPFRMVVRGFSRYAETVDSLPLLEQMKLVIVTDFVMESFLTGNLPIIDIQLIGHADTDPQREQREPGFVQKISEKRAAEIKLYLIHTLSFYWQTFRIPHSSGVGSSQPDKENVRRKKTHANMTEQDRKLNRRVEIFLEPGSTPVPQPTAPSDVLMQAILQWRRDVWMKIHHPPGLFPGILNLPGPLNRDEYISLKCMILEKLKIFQLEDALKTLFSLKDPGESALTTILREISDGIEKQRRAGEDWWKNDDCPQPSPAPIKNAKLVTEHRIYDLKRGGTTDIKVSVVNRPDKRPIQVTLGDLPDKVTAPKRAIPPDRDYVVIPLDAEADAPVTIKRSVFAEGNNAQFVIRKEDIFLKSDMFTVNVQ